jgi:hypothetical protein
MKHTITRRNKRSSKKVNKRRSSTSKSKRISKKVNKRRSKSNRISKKVNKLRSKSSKKVNKRRSKRSSRSSRKGYTIIKKGGGIGNGVLANPPPLDANVSAAYEKLQQAQADQANLIKQNGGSVPCCDENNVYGYPCPDGMCGPIPQSPNEITNSLIRQAATITATGLANAENDYKVNTDYYANKQ